MLNAQAALQEPITPTLSDLKTLVGFPARILIPDSRPPEQAVKIPGFIREVTEAGILLELFFPLTRPYLGDPAVLEVVGKHGLTQTFTTIQRSPNPQSVQVSIPERVHIVQRRRFPRTRLLLAISLTTADAAPAASATLFNLSESGCAISTAEPLAVGQAVKLNLQVIGLALAEVQGRVMRCAPWPTPNGLWEAGLSFYDLSLSQKAALISYIEQHLHEGAL